MSKYITPRSTVPSAEDLRCRITFMNAWTYDLSLVTSIDIKERPATGIDVTITETKIAGYQYAIRALTKKYGHIFDLHLFHSQDGDDDVELVTLKGCNLIWTDLGVAAEDTVLQARYHIDIGEFVEHGAPPPGCDEREEEPESPEE
jgi:hypothetical protein